MSDHIDYEDLLDDPLGVGLTRFQLRVFLLMLESGDMARAWAAAMTQAHTSIQDAQKAAPSADHERSEGR